MDVDAAPVRLTRAEAELTARGLAVNLDDIASLASGEINPMSDLYASDAYRKHVIARC